MFLINLLYPDLLMRTFILKVPLAAARLYRVAGNYKEDIIQNKIMLMLQKGIIG